MQLRCGVALKGEQSIIAVHSMAIVGDANELSATGFDFDPDSGRTGVEGVLEQFFYNGGWAVDYLTCGDLVGHLV
jgi:hypothetical protein